MATTSRVTPWGWEQGDDATDQSRVTPGGWEQVVGSGGSGRIYYVIGPNAGWSTPSAAEVMAGQLSGGSPATASGSELSPTITTDPFTFAADATGLTAGTDYRVAYVWSDE